MRKSGIITKGSDEIMPLTWAENVLVNKETPITDVLISVPQVAEVGQILAVKSVDESGKPVEWEVIKNTAGINDYDELDNLPSINGVTLSGNKSADDLGLLSEEQYKGTVTSINVGSASYTPVSGVVSIPSYPTSLPANGGTAANVSGTVSVLHGGTGATNASSARANLGLGSAAVKGVDTSISASTTSTNLPTSAAVASAIENNTLPKLTDSTTGARSVLTVSGVESGSIYFLSIAASDNVNVRYAPCVYVLYVMNTSSGQAGYLTRISEPTANRAINTITISNSVLTINMKGNSYYTLVMRKF